MFYIFLLSSSQVYLSKSLQWYYKADNTFEKYLFKILDTLFRIPMVMQIRHALRFLALNIMQRFKVWLFTSYASTSKFTQLYPMSSCQQLFVITGVNNRTLSDSSNIFTEKAILYKYGRYYYYIIIELILCATY